jgi:eukaryotic-like serine/threonine-protein kinase
MELVEGPNLRHLLDDRGPLPVDESLRIARGVTAALEHAHRNGIVHRDIKPANVLVPPHAPVKVTDFGIAKAGDGQDLTRTGTVVGTARYLAPEQLAGEPVDARADLYAVGLLLHEMLAGAPPFTGDTETAASLARLTKDPPSLRSVRADVPPLVEAITLRCLARDPRDRYQSAGALGEDLTAVAGGAELHLTSPGVDRTRSATPTPPPTPPPTPTPAAAPAPVPSRAPQRSPGRRPPARRQSSTWPWALLGIFLLAAGAAGGYLVVKAINDTDGTGSTPGVSTSAPQIVGAADFDPEGGDGEHPEQAGLAIDGNGATGWNTETYSNADLGGKSGVGLRVDLADSSEVSTVEVDTNGSGWNAQIYVADSPAETLAGWGAPAASGEDLGPNATFELDPTASGRTVLIWLTRLPASGKLEITEVRIG